MRSREAGANTSLIFVPARFAPDAIYEAVDAGIKTVICITEHIPAHEMLRVYTYVRPKGVTLIGPNCPGVLSPGKANVGIIPAEVFQPGSIGLVSRSGTLTYQIGNELAQRGLGNSTIVGIGGDPVVGSSFIDVLEKFEADPETKYVVLVGEIGGDEEEKAARYVAEHMSKPVFSYIAGFSAPPGKTMGHAGAIISGSSGTAQAKKDALEAVGIKVGTTPTEVAELVAAAADRLGRRRQRQREARARGGALDASRGRRAPRPPRGRSRARGRRPASSAARRRGRSGRRCAAGPPRRCPGRGRRRPPRRPARSPRSARPAGLYFTALSSRFEHRALEQHRVDAAPCVGESEVTNVACGARAFARSTTPATRSSSCTSSMRSLRSSPRASSTRSETSARQRVELDRRLVERAPLPRPPGSFPSRRRSMFVRAAVSGVRSSCDASATSRRWRPTDSSSAASMRVEAASRAGRARRCP